MSYDQCSQCPSLLKALGACPTQSLLASNFQFVEVLMVLASAFPYILAAQLLLVAVLRKTTRNTLLWFLVLSAQILSEAFKLMFRQQRPQGACAKNTNGMPSSHTVFAFAVLTLHILELLYCNVHCVFRSSLYYRCLRAIVFTLAPIAPFSRVYLNYHTVQQVAAGSLLGTATGVILFFLTQKELKKIKSPLVHLLVLIRAKNDYAAAAEVSARAFIVQDSVAQLAQIKEEIKIRSKQLKTAVQQKTKHSSLKEPIKEKE